jgi:protein TonB
MAAWLGLEANGSGGALMPAVAMSVALHVAVLAGVPELATYDDDAPRAPLNARLIPLETPREADAPSPAVPPPVVRDEPRAANPSQAERRAAPPPRREAAAAPAPAPQRPPAREEVAATPAPDVPAAPAPMLASRTESAPAAAAGEPSLAPRAAPDAVDPGSLGQYRLALLGTARRHKLYPEAARERGWEGRVAVELVIGADGTLAAANIRQSSGHGLLDREALEMLKRAATMTPVPPALKGREFRLDVPVLFELRNG